MYELHFAGPMAGAVFFVDSHLLDVGRAALKRLAESGVNALPVVLIISDDEGDPSSGDSDGMDYEDLIKNATSQFDIRWPVSELDPIALNYTSIATVLSYDITAMATYLWTVPMFHGNGWNLTIARHRVTHMGGAPTVLNMIVTAPAADRKPLPATVRVVTGGAPPVPQVLLEMEALGFVMYHVYGLTEDWDALPAEERARRKARQGFHHVAVQDVEVKNPVTTESVPHDGRTLGEVMFRGNTVGDLAVRHPYGYIQVKDRAKDIIISGGENISSIETPCASVKLKEEGSATEAEIVSFCRKRLPHYMAPKTVVFEDLPKTSTGKTQKFVLREKARAMGSLTKTANSKL
ncbi:hypothetical protein SETIT_9G550500v2 [Setaria italica]|uniref:AMP-binding enzyme C-terminal domain-containing protein n=1 Tax=Setaria italica TaxID=4555 RepID=K4ALF6_SETIT|nr:hypothetical protein SETIT_9G550500v2 [Setaria italica]